VTSTTAPVRRKLQQCVNESLCPSLLSVGRFDRQIDQMTVLTLYQSHGVPGKVLSKPETNLHTTFVAGEKIEFGHGPWLGETGTLDSM
jgi:hypothetical protein|tara:strand:- start:1486 stop:1749 length:264 start_codon:yes stop_codon:yes gene_type:complete